jgi:hypothetical protein
MYKLELDVSLVFAPLMDEHGQGIIVTKSFELPFPPFAKMNLQSRQFPNSPGPDGFLLEDITWDVDREVFFARSSLTSVDLPIACILDDIQSWIDLGWRLGSYEETYDDPMDEPEIDSPSDSTIVDPDDDYEWDEMERWPTQPPRKRPARFNKTLRALVRTMAASFNNSATAYAVYKTQQFFSEKELRDNESKPAERFQNAIREYEQMSSTEQIAWLQKVQRTAPRLDRLIARTTATQRDSLPQSM